MKFLEVLVEGESDQVLLGNVLERMGLIEGVQFRIHPHQGRGRLPSNPLALPEASRRGLLDQLPAKLRGFGARPDACAVLVVIDADKDDCRGLKGAILDMARALPRCPTALLVRIAVEESESWLLADHAAVKAAYPRADAARLRAVSPDAVVGAAEVLGSAIQRCAPEDAVLQKREWAAAIAPALDLDQPKSPSFRQLLKAVRRLSTTLQE